MRFELWDLYHRFRIWFGSNICSESIPNAFYQECFRQAVSDSAQYALKNMRGAVFCRTRAQFLRVCLKEKHILGSVCEFGVHKASSLNYIASLLPHEKIHGFDSFRGLNKSFAFLPQGNFALGVGKLPKVRANVVLHQGEFQDSLDEWKKMHPEPLSFVHIDCDLYESTKCIFNLLGEQIVTGTVIAFDDYFAMPLWEDYGYKAFQEFMQNSKKTYKYLAVNGNRVAVIIT